MRIGHAVASTLKQRLRHESLPAPVYYRYRVLEESVWGEHELAVLGEIVRPGGVAIDVGANQGVYAYAFAALARVEAFEPNPAYAAFARRMLAKRASVHTVALSNRHGSAEFVVPLGEDGAVLHLGGNLLNFEGFAGKAQRFPVELRTLDSYDFRDVRVIKVDVEGSELDVLEGGRETILRDKPPLIVELLAGAHQDPAAVTEFIGATYGYDAWLVTQDGARVAALPVIRGLGANNTWESNIRNRNVLFLAKEK